jgi:hypothetical protein
MNMHRQTITAVASVFLFLPLLNGQTPAATGDSTVQVHLDYTGSGTVDRNHVIIVALWDSPDFVKPGADMKPPFAEKTLSSKSGSVKFEHVKQNPVYVSCAYDPTGNWKGDSEPPDGTSLGLYSTQPGVPAAVNLEPGKTAKISLKLDDSFKKIPPQSK